MCNLELMIKWIDQMALILIIDLEKKNALDYIVYRLICKKTDSSTCVEFN